MPATTKYVLKLCHNYAMPLLEMARQYSSLFKDAENNAIIAYLIGQKDNDIATQTEPDKAYYLENQLKELRDLKHKQISQIKQLVVKYNIKFTIDYRNKALYILSHINNLPIVAATMSLAIAFYVITSTSKLL